MLEENLRVTREVSAASSCVPNAFVGSMLDIMSLHLPMRRFLSRWVESCCVTSLGCLFLGAQELTSLAGKLDLTTKCLGRKRNFSARCYKRTCEVITVICLHTRVAYLPKYEYLYSRNGNNKLYFITASGRSSYSMLLRKPRSVRVDPSCFVKLCKKYSICNVE